MSSPQNNAAEGAVAQNARLAQQAFDVGIPGMQRNFGQINQALAMGQPQYLQDAYTVQRTGLADAGMQAQLAAQQQANAAGAQAVKGGNVGAALSPGGMGAQLADALWGSRLQQGMAGVNQQNSLMGLALGQAGDTGNDALRASAGQLDAIKFLQPYNPTWAAILGGANAGGAVYGAFKNQRKPAATLAPGSFTAE